MWGEPQYMLPQQSGVPPFPPSPPPPHHVNRLLGIYVKIAEFPQEKRVGPSSLCSPVAGFFIFFSASRIWRT